MKKELKIREIVNQGNLYIVKCILNEGYFAPETDVITGETYDAFIRTLIKEFDAVYDIVPENVVEVIINVLCEENGWLREDFVNV